MGEGSAKEGLRKIFVGGLNRTTTDDVFKGYFEKFGTIIDFVIIKDSNTKKSKGFGFVTYESLQGADNALSSRPHTLDGWEIDIKRAIPREQNTDTAHQRTKKVFIGGLPPTATENDIKEYFNQTYPGKGTVEKCDLIKNKATGMSKGFAFLEMSSEDFTDLIIIDNSTPSICGKKVEIKKAEERKGAGGQNRRGPQEGYGRNDRGPQDYHNQYDDHERDPYGPDPYGAGHYGGDPYGGDPYGGDDQGFQGHGNVFYPNVGYGGFDPIQRSGYGGGYGEVQPFGDYNGEYGHVKSGYGPMKGGRGPRRGGGSYHGGKPY